MALNWERDGDEERYQRMVDAVRNGRAVAFVGAGLSAPAGYPKWSKLIKDLVRTAGLDGNYVRGEIESGGEQLLQIAEDCKNRLGKCEYYDFLEQQFRPEGPEGEGKGRDLYRPIHVGLMKMPFEAYLTTNYDDCLQQASKAVSTKGRDYYVWPVFDTTDLRAGNIYHLHGHYSNPRTIVLALSDFNRAYDQQPEVRELLNAVYRSQTIVFLGFGLRDPYLGRLLRECKRSYVELARRARDVELCDLPPKQHFALVPLIFREETSQAAAASLRDEPAERSEDSELTEYGIATIRYAPDERHTRLTRIVEEMSRQAGSGWPETDVRLGTLGT